MLFVALFLSGAASLMYQVAWTRRLVTVTSATATAQAFVLAVFMAGLGLGASLAGRWSDRLRRPALAYAQAEVAAAVLALVSLPVIGASDAIRAAAARAGASAGAALWIQLALVSVFLLAPTTLLGASLPLVLEHTDRTGGESARRRARLVPAFYAVNTAGATGGALLAGFVTVERLGLARTAAVGSGLAVAGAAMASWVSRRAPATSREAAPSAPATRGETIERASMAAAAIAGFVGLAAEVVWTRLFALIVPNTVYTFTEVLIAVLIGIAAGSLVAGLAARRLDEPADVMRFAGILSVVAAVMLAAIPLVVVRFAGDLELQKRLASGRSLAAAAALLACLVPASALLGAVLPLLVVASKRTRTARSFGRIYGANIGGSVAGSLLAGFVLIPAIGVKGAGAALQVAALALGVWLLSRSLRPRLAGALGVVGAAACAGLHMAHHVPREIYEARLSPGVRIDEFYEGASSHVLVTDDPQRGGERRLWINSFWVAGSTGPHRVFGLLPGLFTAQPKRVLGIALGSGQTFAAALRHGATHLDCVEIDPGVVALARRWFAEANDGLLDDARVSVHVEDGRTFLRAAQGTYDLIVLEPLQAWSAGTSALYSREFYEDAKRVLAPGGVIAQWIPFYGQGPDETRAMVRTGLEVFHQSSLWLSGTDGVLLLANEPFALPLGAIDARIAERGLGRDLARLPARTAEDLLPFLLLGPTGLARWVADAPVLLDDRPFLEFRAAREIGRGMDDFREILRSALPALDPIAPYLGEGALDASRLDAVERLRRATFDLGSLADEDFDAQMTLLEGLPLDAHRLLLWRSRYQAAVRRGAAAPSTQASGPAAAAAIYERELAHEPRMGEGLINLANLYLAMQKPSDARKLLDRALEIRPVHDEAARILATLAPPEGGAEPGAEAGSRRP